MRSLIHYVFNALMLIQGLWDHSQSMTSFEDEDPVTSHHDSPLTSASEEKLASPHLPQPSLLVERPTSTHYPPHASLDAPFTNPPTLLIDLLPLPNPLVLEATPFIDIPHHPPPLHVSRASSSTNPLPARPPSPPQCHELPHPLILLHIHHHCCHQMIHILLLTWAFIDPWS